jgi:hypothetical protein
MLADVGWVCTKLSLKKSLRFQHHCTGDNVVEYASSALSLFALLRNKLCRAVPRRADQ